jgi:hypothetical protein
MGGSGFYGLDPTAPDYTASENIKGESRHTIYFLIGNVGEIRIRQSHQTVDIWPITCGENG